MARLLSILLVLGLLGGTAAAFAITEGLKLEKSPIARTQTKNPLFSPVCECPKDTTHVDFRLRHAGVLTATVVDQDGDPVATLADHYFRRAVQLTWNGRDSMGNVVPDGVYKLRIHLQSRHQTITLPNTIQVKSRPALIAIKSVEPRVFSPNRDGRADYVTVKYSVSGTARAILFAGGKQVARGRLTRSTGSLHWYAKDYRPGRYLLSMRAEDRAGNISPPTRGIAVRLHFLSLGRRVVHVRRGKRFSLRVVTDAKAVVWRLHGLTGKGAPGPLVLRAPRKTGRYELVVTAVGHSETALVVVGR